jgi:predicted GNAT family acetyltransferase
MEYYRTESGWAWGEKGAQPLALIETTIDSQGNIVIEHTEVAESQRGQGRARALVMLVVEEAKREGTLIVPLCPYARKVLSGDPALKSLIAPGSP